jgi:Rap1a immunity proteins
MRVLAFAALLALAGPAIAMGPPHFQVRNTADYVKLCTTPPGDETYTSAIAFCHGFGVGAYRYYLATTAEADRFVCPPNPAPKRSEVINGFVTWAKTRPDVMQKSAVDSMFVYLSGTYPCKK